MVTKYTDVIERQNLRRKIDLAKRLGFHDDVAHWTVMLENTTQEESN